MAVKSSATAGRDCLRELKQRDSRIQVLIASGYAASDSSEDDIGRAAAGFIGKPYQLSELLAAVRAILGGRQEGWTVPNFDR
jgi:DNA-binding NarL/FixJ family response regulator